MRMNKKGYTNTRTYFTVMILLFLYGFATVLGYGLLATFQTGLTTAGYNTGQAQAVLDKYMSTLLFMDYLIVILLVALIIAVIYLNYRLATSPAFFVVEFFATAVYGFIAYFFNFVFVQLMSDAFFQTYVSAFPITMILCTNLHWIMLGNIVIGAITFFAKREEGPTTFPQQPQQVEEVEEV